MTSPELFVIRSLGDGRILGCAASFENAVKMIYDPRSRVTRGVEVVRYQEIQGQEPEVIPDVIPRGFVGTASMASGVATLPDGTTVNLREVQALLNSHFQESGEPESARAAAQLAKITGLVRGPHGEWEAA